LTHFVDSALVPKTPFSKQSVILQQFCPPPLSTTSKKSEGRIVELMGLMHLDLAIQSKALIGHLEYKLQFTSQAVKFFLNIADPHIVPSAELLDIALFIYRVSQKDISKSFCL